MGVLEDTKALIEGMVTEEGEEDRQLRQMQEAVEIRKEGLVIGKVNRLAEVFQGSLEVSGSEESLLILSFAKELLELYFWKAILEKPENISDMEKALGRVKRRIGAMEKEMANAQLKIG